MRQNEFLSFALIYAELLASIIFLSFSVIFFMWCYYKRQICIATEQQQICESAFLILLARRLVLYQFLHKKSILFESNMSE